VSVKLGMGKRQRNSGSWARAPFRRFDLGLWQPVLDAARWGEHATTPPRK